MATRQTKKKAGKAPAATGYGQDVLPPSERPAPRKKARPSVAEFLAKHGCERLTDDPRAARLLRKYVKLNEDAKALFSKADGIIEELLRTLGPGKTVQIGRSRVAILVDQFAERNVMWRAHAARRYSVETFGEQGK